MKTYNSFQSPIHKVRNAFPDGWAFIRNLYHRARFFYYSERDFIYSVHSAVKLLTPAQVVGISRTGHSEFFFGYYDKRPWSPDGQNLLFHQPQPDGKVQIVLYDSQLGEVRDIAVSSAWNYQQGSMTQWLPGSNGNEILFNDFIEGKLVTRIISIENGASRTISWPIQIIHPNGNEALSLNYCRLDKLRPDYGYCVPAQNFQPDQPLDQDGIWWINLKTSEAELRLSLNELATISPRKEMEGAQHKVNHFYYAPDGQHFVFMHRWFGSHGKFSRLYMADSKLRNLRMLLDERVVSHYSWKDNDHVLVWGKTREWGNHYYLINIHSGTKKIVGENTLSRYGDGHPTFSPDQRWIVTDSYPNKARQRYLLLFNFDTQELIELGRFFAPWKFAGVLRCDLHPRWSPDGKYISFDSAHEGIRKSYILDVRGLVGD